MPAQAHYCMGYITAPSAEEAKAIGKALVEHKLVACANVFSPVQSIYRWEGAVETSEEAVLLVKTSSALQEKISHFVKALHSYSTPCVVFYTMENGEPAYLKWLSQSLTAE